jgi:DNA-directed RNA polymerase subunit RPC12/RpoP
VPKKAMFYVVKTIQGRSIICPKCHAKWYTKLKIPGTVKKQVRRADLLKRYGLTQEDYDRILDEQGGGCGICGKLYVPGQRVFHIDHDHVTGKTRGILCSTCNHLLGNAADSVGILESAVKYLLDCWSKR